MRTEIKSLLKIVAKLQEKYKSKNKKFTLDGRLVGDIGEVLAAKKFRIKLYQKLIKKYDAETIDSKKPIQIKATMKDRLCYPSTFHPKLFLGIKILSNGEIETIYNGDTAPIRKYLRTRKKPQNQNFYTITNNKLSKLNDLVNLKYRILEWK
jgi:hypothetical protein